jgi:hypothetical protein
MVEGYPREMAASPRGLASACTLDGPAFRIREQEFRELFSRALLAFERVDARTARLLFERAYEDEIRDVLARERRCCAFFDFDIEAGERVTVRVPVGCEAALTALLDLG